MSLQSCWLSVVQELSLKPYQVMKTLVQTAQPVAPLHSAGRAAAVQCRRRHRLDAPELEPEPGRRSRARSSARARAGGDTRARSRARAGPRARAPRARSARDAAVLLAARAGGASARAAGTDQERDPDCRASEPPSCERQRDDTLLHVELERRSPLLVPRVADRRERHGARLELRCRDGRGRELRIASVGGLVAWRQGERDPCRALPLGHDGNAELAALSATPAFDDLADVEPHRRPGRGRDPRDGRADLFDRRLGAPGERARVPRSDHPGGVQTNGAGPRVRASRRPPLRSRTT